MNSIVWGSGQGKGCGLIHDVNPSHFTDLYTWLREELFDARRGPVVHRATKLCMGYVQLRGYGYIIKVRVGDMVFVKPFCTAEKL